MNPFGLGPRAVAYYAARAFDLRVEGLANVPARGPAVIAARHYHHLYDGAALILALPRQPHLFVALDWTRSPWERLAMETLCNLAEWPVALRADNLAAGRPTRRSEARRYLRAAAARTTSLLGRGRIVAIFPEGYPTIDPAGSRKDADDAYLPFRSGAARLAIGAARAAAMDVPLVPAGLAYAPRRGGGFRVQLRFGAALSVARRRPAELSEELAARVRELSAP